MPPPPAHGQLLRFGGLAAEVCELIARRNLELAEGASPLARFFLALDVMRHRSAWRRAYVLAFLPRPATTVVLDNDSISALGRRQSPPALGRLPVGHEGDRVLRPSTSDLLAGARDDRLARVPFMPTQRRPGRVALADITPPCAIAACAPAPVSRSPCKSPALPARTA